MILRYDWSVANEVLASLDAVLANHGVEVHQLISLYEPFLTGQHRVYLNTRHCRLIGVFQVQDAC